MDAEAELDEAHDEEEDGIRDWKPEDTPLDKNEEDEEETRWKDD